MTVAADDGRLPVEGGGTERGHRLIGPLSKTDARPLLDWLLRKHPDTPKSRAKQWILAGRVSIGGVVMRKPHQPVPDP
ncbi:MAG: S4 domain-containing protein, partial [Verrucomicrobia bacterium]|nr:S4 domain-containing protein [Verrucomicrobiota bacterium]